MRNVQAIFCSSLNSVPMGGTIDGAQTAKPPWRSFSVGRTLWVPRTPSLSGEWPEESIRAILGAGQTLMRPHRPLLRSSRLRLGGPLGATVQLQQPEGILTQKLR